MPSPGGAAEVSGSATLTSPAAEVPGLIGAYRVLALIGNGGMARVFRVADEHGRERALKQLHASAGRTDRALFEREFHTLAQLAHPRMIQVFDYGVADAGPYYTMELLDGGDLRARSPLPWREACRVGFEIGSSLALLHSRKLVHRDISPRNVRCTEHGGAKLIDFGAMAAMGPGSKAVGTPAFIAPEVVHRGMLDGRTDVYSLGATLYYALTGRPPYQARDIAGTVAAWSAAPIPPSSLAGDVPADLDALIMSMMSQSPALRPRGAYEVMQRLTAIAGMPPIEPQGVARAYLVAPVLVGRERVLDVFRARMHGALRGEGSGLLVQAQAGLGRSRLLDAFTLEAKLLGATTLRANARERRAAFAAARELTEQLIDAHPGDAAQCARELGLLGELFDERATDAQPRADGPDGTPPAPTPSLAPLSTPSLALRDFPDDPIAQLGMQIQLADWFARVSRRHPLLLAIDDVERVDRPSVAMLAAIASRWHDHPLVAVLTAEPDCAKDTPALTLLARRCSLVPLPALDRGQVIELLTSVFGDVPNVAVLGELLHSAANGRPRECMALAEHLVDRELITYSGGAWTLPPELDAGDLPARAEDVFPARLAALEPHALRLARLHSLSLLETLTREDYLLLSPRLAAAEVDAALSELVAHDVLRGDRHVHEIANRTMREALQAPLGSSERIEAHLALAELYAQTGKPPIATAWHLLAAERSEQALELLAQAFGTTQDATELVVRSGLPEALVARVLERALDVAEQVGCTPRLRCELSRFLLLLSHAVDDLVYVRVAPGLLAQLEQDSGLALLRAAPDAADAGQRLTQALQTAVQRYQSAPADERVYRVDEAIRHLAYYVVISLAAGVRALDDRLLRSLPPLLEPFAPLSPIVHAIWQNALATHDTAAGRPEQSYDRWLALYERLEEIGESQLEGVDRIRNAVAFALGSCEAQDGRDSVERWTALLDRDPMQRVNAMYLRKIASLHRGDFESAERYRREAELLAAQAAARQMFFTTSILELNIHALTHDLTGVKQVADRIAPLAERYPGWRPYRELADAHFHRLRGDLATARAACERALQLSGPSDEDPDGQLLMWCTAAAVEIGILVELDLYAEAKAFGDRTLARCAERGIVRSAYEIAQQLALAEAKLGDIAGATARVDAVITAREAHGDRGLALGASYEARVRIAIAADDRAAVERFGQLAAHEYRHGRAAPLGARYQRLIHAAQAAGISDLPRLEAVQATEVGETTSLGPRSGSPTSRR